MFGAAILGLFVIITVARWRHHRGGKWCVQGACL